MVYTLCLILFLIGLYAVMIKKNLVKIIIGIVIMEYSVNLFLILIGYRHGGIPPILTKDTHIDRFVRLSVDPLPQAFVLTSIVIGLGTIALMVAMAIRIYEKYKTFDITKIKKLKG